MTSTQKSPFTAELVTRAYESRWILKYRPIQYKKMCKLCVKGVNKLPYKMLISKSLTFLFCDVSLFSSSRETNVVRECSMWGSEILQRVSFSHGLSECHSGTSPRMEPSEPQRILFLGRGLVILSPRTTRN